LNTVESVLWTPPPSYEINGPVVDMIKTFWALSFSRCKKGRPSHPFTRSHSSRCTFFTSFLESLAANFQPPSADISMSISVTSVTVGFGPASPCDRTAAREDHTLSPALNSSTASGSVWIITHHC